MPIAAVPAYLGNDFKDASPALRFGMYLKLWGINRRSNATLWTTYDIGYEVRGQQRQEREVRYENKTDALKQSAQLTDSDKRANASLALRQSALAATLPEAQLLRLDARGIAPFTTGLGNEHPLENGFAFLNPYGLPYLPGSGVKGVLRQAAQELASGQWGGHARLERATALSNECRYSERAALARTLDTRCLVWPRDRKRRQRPRPRRAQLLGCHPADCRR